MTHELQFQQGDGHAELHERTGPLTPARAHPGGTHQLRCVLKTLKKQRRSDGENKIAGRHQADPSRFYPAPTDVVRDRRFSDTERLEILEAWERDARALPWPTKKACPAASPAG